MNPISPPKASATLLSEIEEIQDNARTIRNRVEAIHDLLFGYTPTTLTKGIACSDVPSSAMSRLVEARAEQIETHVILDKIVSQLN